MAGPAVLVVRGDGRFSRLLRREGFDTVELELVRTEPIEDLTEFSSILSRIGDYDGIFITSPAAAEVFVGKLNGGREVFNGKFYVLGERSKTVLRNSGFTIEPSGPANTAEELISSFADTEFSGKKLLFVRGDRTVGSVRKMLGGIAKLDESIVYRSRDLVPDERLVSEILQRLRGREIVTTCFFSPSGVERFASVFADVDPGTVSVSAIGKTTAHRASVTGFDLEFVSSHATVEDFASGLAAYLKRNN